VSAGAGLGIACAASTANANAAGADRARIAFAGERAAKRTGPGGFDAAAFAEVAFVTAAIAKCQTGVDGLLAWLQQRYVPEKAIFVVEFPGGVHRSDFRESHMHCRIGKHGAMLALRWMAFGDEWVEVALTGRGQERIVFAVGNAPESEFEKAMVTFAGYRFVPPPQPK
jgi:hypothetical protein